MTTEVWNGNNQTMVLAILWYWSSCRRERSIGPEIQTGYLTFNGAKVSGIRSSNCLALTLLTQSLLYEVQLSPCGLMVT
jgi:hypothetical protein